VFRNEPVAGSTGQFRLAGRSGQSHAADGSRIPGGQERSSGGAETGRTMTERPGVVLVADDDAVNRLLLGHSLERDGHRVRAVANGLEALEALAGAQFDCVLLDVLMPGMDGYQVLERIRSEPKLR